MPREKPRFRKNQCHVCEGDIIPYQVISEVPVGIEDDGRYKIIRGHYHCVKEALGPERLLKAVELGIFPLLKEAIFTEDRRLKKYVDLIESKKNEEKKIYEFIQS